MDESYIVGLFFARDEAALAECRRRYGAYCRAIARNILGREADAEECENDVYLAAWNAIPPAQPRSLRAFLGKIARNLSINRLDARRAKKRGGGELTLALSELEGCLSDGPPVEELAEARELAEFLARFVHGLPEAKRKVFIRRYWYLSPVAEIARDYGMSEAKVTSMRHRMREKLKSALEKEGYRL